MRTALAILLLIPSWCLAQSVRSTKAVFHVTTVRYVDKSGACVDTGNCLETEVHVDGYINGSPGSRVEYRLTCSEIRSMETKSLFMVCSRVHANSEYNVKVFDTGVMSFWPEAVAGEDHSTWSAFKIVSEKEISRPAR